MRYRKRSTTWYHVTVTTYRRRKVFKIAATARFCERVLAETCTAQGWRLDTLVVRADTIQALLQVPAAVRGRAVVRRLKVAAATVVRQRPVCDIARRIFETGHWCAVVTEGAKVAAVRRHLRARGVSMPAATAPP